MVLKQIAHPYLFERVSEFLTKTHRKYQIIILVYLILNLIVIIIIGVLGGEKRSLYYAAIALSIIAFLCLIGATITKYLSYGFIQRKNSNAKNSYVVTYLSNLMAKPFKTEKRNISRSTKGMVSTRSWKLE